MFIGYYENPKLSYHMMGSDISLPPAVNEETGALSWDWKFIHNSALDIDVDLEKECFVGSVTLPFTDRTQVYKVQIISKGKIIGEHTARTNKVISDSTTVAIGVTLDKFTIRIFNAYSTITVSEIRISVAYEDGKPLIWPTPKSYVLGEGAVRIGKTVTDGSDESTVAEGILTDGITKKLGRDIRWDSGVPVSLSVDREIEKERIISVKTDGISVRAGGRLALCRASCILATMVNSDGTVAVSELDDIPACEMRGFHLGIPARHNIGFVRDLYRYILLPLGYNMLFMQFCGGMRYDSHPEITEAWIRGNQLAKEGKLSRFPHDYMGAEGTVLEKAEVRELIDYAKSLGFEIIPEVQSLGHVQYITFAHPEIGEIDENEKQVLDSREEDLRPDGKFIHCYCPSNEESYRIIFDLIDEIIEVARPERYLHIGHDEVYHLGLCPRCRGKSHADLFVGDVMRLYNHLKEKGLGTMMWGDMLQPVTKYDTKQSINMLPKDIVQLDFIWYFHLDKNIEDNLIAAGYTTIAGNLYSSHFPRYRSRMLNSGMKGGQISLWCALNEYAMGKKGKFWDTTLTAQYLARPEMCEDDMRWAYSYVMQSRIQPVQRDLIRGKYTPAGWKRKSFALPRGCKCGIPESLLKYRKSARIADGVKVKIGGFFDRIAIEGATLNIGIREPWVPLKVCGDFTVRYSDGTEASFPYEYGGGVHHVNRRYGEPFPEPTHRHTGYSGTWFSDPSLDVPDGHGDRLLLTEYLIENPYPEKKVVSISYAAREDDTAKAIVTGVYGITKA